MSYTLYELNEIYQNIQQLIEDGTDGLEDALKEIEEKIEDKAVNYAKVIKNLEAQTKAIKEEEKRLADRRKAIENNITRLKLTLQESMELNDVKRVKNELFTINIQNNPPSLKVNDDAIIPQEYYIEQEPKLDRRELLNAIKNGAEIKGVEITQGQSLRIR